METVSECVVQNPKVVFREEFDNWAIIFNPDSNETYGLDSLSAFIWKKLDGKHSIEEIAKLLEKECIDTVPENAKEDITDFIKDLVNEGLARIEK